MTEIENRPNKYQGQPSRPDEVSWSPDLNKDTRAALLEPLSTPGPVDLKAMFLGPKAENADLVEQLLLNVYRDYVFWRLIFINPGRIKGLQSAYLEGYRFFKSSSGCSKFRQQESKDE
jgi:hypothetical protein